MRSSLRKLARLGGLEVHRTGPPGSPPPPTLPADFDAETRDIVRRVQPETMTSPERICAVVEAMRHVDRFRIPGAFVECGVWRGGASMAAALAHADKTRDLWLFDTFEGMSSPTDVDVEHHGRRASAALEQEAWDSDVWAIASLDVVQRNMASTDYPAERLHYVRGKVEDTVPATTPEKIAVLRLDTDWYESTRHELEHLAPLIAPGGVLIIDDYGHWQGARRAVDEWIAARAEPLLLARTDYTGRVAMLP